ncbi:DGQHR domain-containing protein [Limnoraphis robusta CS-951]|uniref:DGQHR domain-containing protein n=2 Tax=Limnoraphis TaxID=1332112 RepID=A0A0F5YGK2_9CYAN|nr:DGQHR domain-containing protein [Limnoraphis robusta CS-951]
MNEISDNLPEENPRIDSVLAPLFSKNYRENCYLGLMFQQGKRQMIQINVPAREIPTLLEAKPSEDNDPDSGKNRPVVKGHAEEIKDYIVHHAEQDKPWILGTLTANIDPEKIQVIELGRGMCFVVIPRDTRLDITDGQHRQKAIDELVRSKDAKLIGDSDFPITLVLEGNFKQCQKDFRDMAQTKELAPSLLLSYGEVTGQVGILKELVEKVSMFRGKTEKITGKPAAKKKLIYTNKFIATLVSCAFENDPNATLETYDVDAASQALADALNQFFSECPQTQYVASQSPKDLKIEEIDDFIKEKSILGRSVGLEILGRLLYLCYNENEQSFDSEKISQLAQLDWSQSSSLWANNVVTIDPNPKNPAKPYSISNNKGNVKIAVNTAKAQLGWM